MLTDRAIVRHLASTQPFAKDRYTTLDSSLHTAFGVQMHTHLDYKSKQHIVHRGVETLAWWTLTEQSVVLNAQKITGQEVVLDTECQRPTLVPARSQPVDLWPFIHTRATWPF